MKKLYTLITASILLTGVNAQDYNLTPNDTVSEIVEVNGYYSPTIYMEHDNTTTDSLELMWEQIENTAPVGWDYSYCDWTNCYAGNITSGTMSKIGPNQSGFIKVNVLPPSVGTAKFRFKVWKTSDPTDIDTITFLFEAILGVSDLYLGEKVSVYPNPSNGEQVTINNILPNSELVIQNALGQVVLSRNVGSSKLSISNLALRRGVYFIRLEREGNQYATRKLIVK